MVNYFQIIYTLAKGTCGEDLKCRFYSPQVPVATKKYSRFAQSKLFLPSLVDGNEVVPKVA